VSCGGHFLFCIKSRKRFNLMWLHSKFRKVSHQGHLCQISCFCPDVDIYYLIYLRYFNYCRKRLPNFILCFYLNPTHHPGNRDQENHTRHPQALQIIVYILIFYTLILQIVFLSIFRLDTLFFSICLWMDCNKRLRLSSCSMPCMNGILCDSHIHQSCTYRLLVYTRSESHHTSVVDVDHPE